MNAQSSAVQLLKAVPFFADLAPAVRAAIAARCRAKSLQAGQLLFMEGDPCQDLYILELGRVNFYRTSPEGREQILKVFEHPGDTFCISSAFHTGRHIVSARAVTETRLRLVDVDTVHRLAQDHPSMALKLVATAGEQMTHLVALAEDLSLKTATARLAKYLCELAAAEGVKSGKEIRLARARIPEEELASMLGTVRVHISRSLMNLVRAGAINLNREFIRIRDLAMLQQISEGK